MPFDDDPVDRRPSERSLPALWKAYHALTPFEERIKPWETRDGVFALYEPDNEEAWIRIGRPVWTHQFQ